MFKIQNYNKNKPSITDFTKSSLFFCKFDTTGMFLNSFNHLIIPVMASKIFINLAVKDLKKAINFFTTLGFSFNPQFTDEHATCMIIGEIFLRC